MERKNAWLSYTEADEKEMEALAEAYKSFLDNGKTERECVDRTIEEARAKGYVSLEEKLEKGEMCIRDRCCSNFCHHCRDRGEKKRNGFIPYQFFWRHIPSLCER